MVRWRAADLIFYRMLTKPRRSGATSVTFVYQHHILLAFSLIVHFRITTPCISLPCTSFYRPTLTSFISAPPTPIACTSTSPGLLDSCTTPSPHSCMSVPLPPTATPYPLYAPPRAPSMSCRNTPVCPSCSAVEVNWWLIQMILQLKLRELVLQRPPANHWDNEPVQLSWIELNVTYFFIGGEGRQKGCSCNLTRSLPHYIWREHKYINSNIVRK